MTSKVALCSVVTWSCLEEFQIMKFSFEHFHGASYQWFVRCDRQSFSDLSRYPNVKCTLFEHAAVVRPDLWSTEFRSIVHQKMRAVADAWSAGEWQAVMFLDADLIVTARFMDTALATPGDLVLTPHFRPSSKKYEDEMYGSYNSGFLLTRAPQFHEWWENAFISAPERFTDQACLDDAGQVFTIGCLNDRANIGFWRAPRRFSFPEIPADCLFLHVHLYQMGRSGYETLHRVFALHCIEFLHESPESGHRAVLGRVVASRSGGWYKKALKDLFGGLSPANHCPVPMR